MVRSRAPGALLVVMDEYALGDCPKPCAGLGLTPEGVPGFPSAEKGFDYKFAG